MPLQLEFEVFGLEDVEAALRGLPGQLARRVQGEGLIAVARAAAAEADTPNYGFTDRTGRLRPTIRATRRAIRVHTAAGNRVTVPGAGARLRVGGPGARQGYLVEAGHGGPRPARPHPYLIPATIAIVTAKVQIGINAMRRAFRRLNRQARTGRVPSITLRVSSLDR